MNRQEKKKIIESVIQSFSLCESAFIISCPKLDVIKSHEIRKKLYSVGGKFVTVKNTLLRLVAKQNNVAEILIPLFQNKISIIFAFKDSSLNVAKIVKNSGLGVDIFIKGGVFDGKNMEVSKFEFIASIPPKSTLHAMLCGSLKNPIVKLVSVLQKIVESKSN